ncbi:MAG: hypothetical protein WCB10_12070 [Steroidobacteraceae bacterium]
MSDALVLIVAGRLHDKPVARPGKAGELFATCSLRVSPSDGEPIFVSVTAFEKDVVAALVAHAGGDLVALAGEFSPRALTAPDGSVYLVLDVTAHTLLQPYRAATVREASSLPDHLPGEV